MNKKYWIVLACALLACVTFGFDLEGRGGGKGGGGHGGGGHGGGRGHKGGGHRGGEHQAHRTPSMSRQGHGHYQRSAKTFKEHSSRTQSKNYLQHSKERHFDHEKLNQKQHEFKNRRGEWNREHRRHADHVRDRFRHDHHDYHHWFNHDFFDHHHFFPGFFNSNVNWWGVATWGSLLGWLSWEGLSPIYYESDGYPINIEQESGGYLEPYPSNISEEQKAPQEPVQGDWLPLGVFALGQDEKQAAVSNMVIQLAINKNGDIGGTYYNTTTDETHEIEGTVDKETQQVVFKLSGNPNAPLVKTGLYNLTQDESEATVHFPDGTEQKWVLIRLNDNKDSKD